MATTDRQPERKQRIEETAPTWVWSPEHGWHWVDWNAIDDAEQRSAKVDTQASS